MELVFARMLKAAEVMHKSTVSRPASEKVYLAVGDDAKQCSRALQWALHFIPPQMLLVLVHIYRPATTVPRMGLGASMQASMLREDFVSAYRENVRNMIEKTIVECLQNCKVQAEVLIIDKDDVAVALLELIKVHKITTLVMGAKNRHGQKSKTAVALEKQADLSCNILYLHNGILVSTRHQGANVCTTRKNEIPSLGGCHYSGSSNTTNSKSSSFFNSRSTADTFDDEQLNDPSLEMHATYIFNDNRFSVIVGLESFVSFRKLINQQFLAEHSRDLYQTFHIKCCDLVTRFQSIGGFDSVLGVDYQKLGEAHWKSIKSWPAVLEYIVSVLNTLHMQLLNQNHRACNGFTFTHQDLLEAAKKPIRRLFDVASIISDHEVRKSPEKLFCLLNMYAALMDATPTLREVFYTEPISTDIEGVLAKLKDSAGGILNELKGLIQTYSSQKVVQDGSIPLITGYLMRYIRLLVKHKGSLDTMLGHDHANLLAVEGMRLTGRLVFGLIVELESVLEKQSKSFASIGLRCIFLMNNTNFILQEIEQSDLQLIVGAKWITKCQDCIKGYMKRYLSASWGPVTSTLVVAKDTPPRKRPRINLNFLYSGPTPLQSFASALNETCNAQMSWKVPSPALRDELREKILKFVTQAYHAHLESQKQSVGRNAKDFEPEWKRKISELFEG